MHQCRQVHYNDYSSIPYLIHHIQTCVLADRLTALCGQEWEWYQLTMTDLTAIQCTAAAVCVWSTLPACKSEWWSAAHSPMHSCRPSGLLMVHAVRGTQIVSVT